MGRPVVHWELWSESPEKVSRFYEQVSDWKVKRAGGKIVLDKTDVPGLGQLSLFEDPDGRVLGMWKQQR